MLFTGGDSNHKNVIISIVAKLKSVVSWVYRASMRPTYNGSTALQCFEHGNTIKMCNGIMFLPGTATKSVTTLLPACIYTGGRRVWPHTTLSIHLLDLAVGNIRKLLWPRRRKSEWLHLGIVTIDKTRSMSVHLDLILSEVNRAGLHGLQELILVNEGDEDNSFPLLLLPIQICLEVHRVEVLQWRVFIDHQALWRNRPVAPSPQTILAQSSRYLYSVVSYPDWSGYKA